MRFGGRLALRRLWYRFAGLGPGKGGEFRPGQRREQFVSPLLEQPLDDQRDGKSDDESAAHAQCDHDRAPSVPPGRGIRAAECDIGAEDHDAVDNWPASR